MNTFPETAEVLGEDRKPSPSLSLLHLCCLRAHVPSRTSNTFQEAVNPLHEDSFALEQQIQLAQDPSLAPWDAGRGTVPEVFFSPVIIVRWAPGD